MKGRRRIVTDEQLAQILAWQPLRNLAKDVGISVTTAWKIREKQRKQGWVYKKPYVEKIV